MTAAAFAAIRYGGTTAPLRHPLEQNPAKNNTLMSTWPAKDSLDLDTLNLSKSIARSCMIYKSINCYTDLTILDLEIW